CKGSEDKALGLPLEEAFGLELSENPLRDKERGESVRLRAWVLGEKFANDPVEFAAIDQIAASQVPDEPFAGAEVRSRHVRCTLPATGQMRAWNIARNSTTTHRLTAATASGPAQVGAQPWSVTP